MSDVEKAYNALDTLCRAIKSFSKSSLETSTYRAPIIDHFHPDDYCQKFIAGLSRFSSHCHAERDYVEGILKSNIPVKDFTTNAPNLLAVWAEFVNSPRPLLLISQMLDVEGHGQVKLDAIVDGGNEWIKVSTIREARLLAEFREQDSYINSDYDSDSEYEAGPDGIPTPRSSSPAPLSNSLVTQARSLVNAAKAFRRPAGLPQPRIRFVLNRMEERQEYQDPRVEETFEIIRQMGIDLVLGTHPRSSMTEHRYQEPIPASNILLDLSVLVALCCDSAHQPLPADEEGLESRFRALCPSTSESNTELELTPHSNVTRDLRDQLQWEVQHSLIDELQTRLAKTVEVDGGNVQFWVTEEVKGRLPNIIDTIGGPEEKARAKALFGEDDGGIDFWENSRWKGRAPALGDMRLNILTDNASDSNLAKEIPDISTLSLHDRIPPFTTRLVIACDHLLQPPSSGSITPPAPLHRQKYRRARQYKTQAVPTTRLPSQHTLNSFAAGAKRGWTVLTNNRGAVGKVMRDMGVKDGLPFDDLDDVDKRVVIWVVNPSSLSEWRRLEVEESNRALLSGQNREESRVRWGKTS